MEKLCTDVLTGSCNQRVPWLMWFAVSFLDLTPSPVLGKGQTRNGLRTGEKKTLSSQGQAT